ncbi:MAG: class I SAM-dependent methyltransferase [Acidobacteria bacterium]|nr:class I SAM-dependent methyltransferase [Acidobacteriota bacterium]
MNSSLDFGYPWWLHYGHLTIASLAGLFLYKGPKARWARCLLFGIAAWALLCFMLIQFGARIDSVAELPTGNFLASNQGKVLDLGAGTGRSAIMVLRARPGVTVVALDLFGESFDMHFGRGPDPQQLLRANLKAAGVEERTSIVAADMRKLPFENASFEGIVSAFAVDHLNREGVGQTLAESARVLKPNGEFLLIVTNGRDPWARFAFGPLLAHGGFRASEWWEARLRESGLQVAEKGTSPPAFYFVAKRS